MAQIGLLEDNPRIAKLCVTFLHFAGHEVTVYETSKKCLSALLFEAKSHDGCTFSLPSVPCTCSLPVEILILDLSLPDMDGIDVLKYLTSHPHTQALPLILCTAAANSEIVKARRVAPHASVVVKPFHLQTLVSAISIALEGTML